MITGLSRYLDSAYDTSSHPYTIVLTNQIAADQYIQEVLVIPHSWHFCKRLKTIKVNQKPSQTESAETQIRQLLGESSQTKDDSPRVRNPAGSR